MADGPRAWATAGPPAAATSVTAAGRAMTRIAVRSPAATGAAPGGGSLPRTIAAAPSSPSGPKAARPRVRVAGATGLGGTACRRAANRKAAFPPVRTLSFPAGKARSCHLRSELWDCAGAARLPSKEGPAESADRWRPRNAPPSASGTAKGSGSGLEQEEPSRSVFSEAEELKRRIEELRERLYAQPGVTYEDSPELHDELDRLIIRYVRLTVGGRLGRGQSANSRQSPGK